ncbi:MAG: hypothetical protein QOG27_47 [Verrucomicrobiota bacterium]
MFPLNATTLPSSAAALERLLNDSLRSLFHTKTDPVALRAAAYPHLDDLHIALDGATLRDNPPPPPSISSPETPALEIDSLKINAAALSAGPAVLDLSLSAQNVILHQAPDSAGNIVLVLHRAADGVIAISASRSDLEAAIAEVAKMEAGRHGVTIDGVQLSLRSRSSRSLGAEVRLRARKLFLSATIRITGQLDLDEQLNARISGLDCLGEGAIAGVACGVLKPHLQKLDGRSFPLMSLPLGEVRLRDVQLAAGDRLSVTAHFGTAT